MQGELRWDEDEIDRLDTAEVDEILAEYEAEPSGTGMLTMLRKLGHQVTQPGAGRDPREPGAARSGEGDPTPSWIDRADESPFRKVQGLIQAVFAVEPTVIFMRTKKGAGPAVAAAIHESDWWDVLAGTSTASDSVILVTENKLLQDQVMERLKLFYGRHDEAGGDIERRPHHE